MDKERRKKKHSSAVSADDQQRTTAARTPPPPPSISNYLDDDDDDDAANNEGNVRNDANGSGHRSHASSAATEISVKRSHDNSNSIQTEIRTDDFVVRLLLTIFSISTTHKHTRFTIHSLELKAVKSHRDNWIVDQFEPNPNHFKPSNQSKPQFIFIGSRYQINNAPT